MGFARIVSATTVWLILCVFTTRAAAYSFSQLNFTSAPSQAFVGSFAGPIYSPGVAEPTCSVLISPGLGTTTFLVVPNVTYTDPQCTNLASIPFADYTFLGVTQVKCTGSGQGYQLNYPAFVVGAPDTVGGQFFCIKFKIYNNVTEMTFTEGYSADIQCPDTFSNATLIASNPGNNAGFVVYYALQGAQFPPC